MDPLTATLAVIALATAVKDITELRIKIRESFAKVPKNLLNTERVVRDISEMLEDIVEFSKQNQETLENAQDFRTALQDLIKALRGFESSTLTLLQELKTCGRFSRMWTSWRKREEIEATVQQLRDAVKMVVKRHLMRGALRTELNTERIHHATSQIQRDITHLCATTTTALALTPFSSTPLSDNIDQSILILANTSSMTSVPMLQAPAIITDEIMSKAFVKFQVGGIVSVLERLRELPIEHNVGGCRESNSVQSSPYIQLPVAQFSMTTTQLWYRAMQEVIHSRSLLEAWSSRISMTIWDSAVYLATLARTLNQLSLTDEKLMIGKWRITLHRMLVSAEPDQSIHRVWLARALLDQAQYYHSINEMSLALELIKEASQIARNLPYTKESQALLSAILVDHASMISTTSGVNQLAISLSMESVETLEDALDVPAIGCDLYIIEHDGSPSVNPIFIRRLFSAPSTFWLLYRYALAQAYLGQHLSAEHRLEEALKCLLLSITIFHRMLVEYPGRVRYELAITLKELIMSPALALLVPEKQSQYINETIEIWQNLVSQNPVFFGQYVVIVLYRKAVLLHEVNKYQESAEVCQEAVTLAQQVISNDQHYVDALGWLSGQFRLLGRYNEAANTCMLVVKRQRSKDIQVSVYHDLCFDLLYAGRIEDALQAAEKSVLSGRILALKDAARCTVVLLRSLHCLARCLIVTGNQDGALQKGREMLRIMGNLIKDNSPLLQEPVLLHYISSFALLLDDEQQSLAFMSDVLSLFQKLAVCNPKDQEIASHLLACQYRQAQNFFQLNLPLKAQSCIEELLQTWEEYPPSFSDEKPAHQNIVLLNVYAEILHNLGQSDQALDVLDKAVRLAQPYLRNGRILHQMVESTRWRIVITSGLQANGENVLKLARETPAAGNKGLVSSLHIVGIAASHNKMYKRLVEASEESLDVCHGDDGMSLRLSPDSTYPLDPSLACLPKSMQLLSSGLANLGRLAEGIQYAKEAVECSLKLRMTLTVASFIRTQSYIETRGNLANILIANGDLDEAVQILEEQREHFSNRVEVRNGEYRDLVPTLRTLGVLFCHLGRHEEGKAATGEFQRIMQTLAMVFPSLHNQVIVHLERDLDTPILQPLEDMRNNLQCNHQQGVSIT